MLYDSAKIAAMPIWHISDSAKPCANTNGSATSAAIPAAENHSAWRLEVNAGSVFAGAVPAIRAPLIGYPPPKHARYRGRASPSQGGGKRLGAARRRSRVAPSEQPARAEDQDQHHQ